VADPHQAYRKIPAPINRALSRIKPSGAVAPSSRNATSSTDLWVPRVGSPATSAKRVTSPSPWRGRQVPETSNGLIFPAAGDASN